MSLQQIIPILGFVGVLSSRSRSSRNSQNIKESQKKVKSLSILFNLVSVSSTQQAIQSGVFQHSLKVNRHFFHYRNSVLLSSDNILLAVVSVEIQGSKTGFFCFVDNLSIQLIRHFHNKTGDFESLVSVTVSVDTNQLSSLLTCDAGARPQSVNFSAQGT